MDHVLPHQPELVVEIQRFAMFFCARIIESRTGTKEGSFRRSKFVCGGKDGNVTKIREVVVVSTPRTDIIFGDGNGRGGCNRNGILDVVGDVAYVWMRGGNEKRQQLFGKGYVRRDHLAWDENKL